MFLCKLHLKIHTRLLCASVYLSVKGQEEQNPPHWVLVERVCDQCKSSGQHRAWHTELNRGKEVMVIVRQKYIKQCKLCDCTSQFRYKPEGSRWCPGTSKKGVRWSKNDAERRNRALSWPIKGTVRAQRKTGRGPSLLAHTHLSRLLFHRLRPTIHAPRLFQRPLGFPGLADAVPLTSVPFPLPRAEWSLHE